MTSWRQNGSCLIFSNIALGPNRCERDKQAIQMDFLLGWMTEIAPFNTPVMSALTNVVGYPA